MDITNMLELIYSGFANPEDFGLDLTQTSEDSSESEDSEESEED